MSAPPRAVKPRLQGNQDVVFASNALVSQPNDCPFLFGNSVLRNIATNKKSDARFNSMLKAKDIAGQEFSESKVINRFCAQLWKKRPCNPCQIMLLLPKQNKPCEKEKAHQLPSWQAPSFRTIERIMSLPRVWRLLIKNRVPMSQVRSDYISVVYCLAIYYHIIAAMSRFWRTILALFHLLIIDFVSRLG